MQPELPDHDALLAQQYRELPDPLATPELDARILLAATVAVSKPISPTPRMAANQSTWHGRSHRQRFAGMAASV